MFKLIKQEVKHSYYDLSIKGEKYQLDWSKLLTEKQNKNKSKKKFVGVIKKYLKIEEYLTYMMGSYLKEINVQNALEYS